jgi:L-rhamnose-H+ transport protein
MTSRLWIGFVLTLLAGLLAGNCMLPMKFARCWPWESVWLVFSIVSLLILPWTLAFVMIANLFAVYAALPASAFVVPVLFGAGWGIAQILFGLSITRLGMALGYAIVVGLGALLGTLIPLLVKHSEIAASGRGAPIFAGVAVMILGIVVVAWAGRKREGVPSARVGIMQNTYAAALALAVLCGLLAPMLNYAFAFGDSIASEAVRLGNSSEAAGYAVWPVALLGGLVPNVGYASFLLWRNCTWKSFHGAWRSDAWCGIAMGVMWMAAFAIYGVSSVYLGALGTSAGWALFQIFMIMTANCSGLLTAEWKGAPPSAKYRMAAGLALLSTATALIAPRS